MIKHDPRSSRRFRWKIFFSIMFFILLTRSLLGVTVGSSVAQIVSFSAATNFTVGGSPFSVAVGDFNGDGKPDLAVAGDNVSILLGHGDGTFGSPTYLGL